MKKITFLLFMISIAFGYSQAPTVDPATPPMRDAADVVSIFSDAYANITGANYNPNWGQSGFGTADTAYEPTGAGGSGNTVLSYTNFNYQGVDYNGAQDVSAMEFLHVDIWTDGGVAPNVFIISPGPVETAYAVSNVAGSWQSIDIPLGDFSPVDLTNVIQFKFDGGDGSASAIYVDNLYFWKNPTAAGTDATLSDLQIDGATITGFSPNVENYTVDLPSGTTIVPQITLTTTTDASATVTSTTQASGIPGDATVLVTAADGMTTKTYMVSFAITEPGQDAPTPPARNANDVISIFSEAYSNVSNVDYNPNWGQSGFGSADTANEIVSGSGNLSLKYPNFNYQGNDFNGAQDISAMEFLHVDIWTNDMSPNVFVISSGVEIPHAISSQPGSWKSVDIPIAGITGDLTNAIQFKFDNGNGGTIYVDNLYFYKGTALSVDEFDANVFNVYPNPTSNVWNVVATQTVNTIELYNILGKKVMSITPDAKNITIDATVLGSGIYLARISSDSGTKTIKLVKE